MSSYKRVRAKMVYLCITGYFVILGIAYFHPIYKVVPKKSANNIADILSELPQGKSSRCDN